MFIHTFALHGIVGGHPSVKENEGGLREDGCRFRCTNEVKC